MLKHLFQFTLLLLFVSGAAYMLHIWLNRQYFEGPVALINFSYKFNIGITFIFTTSIILVRERLKEQLGFLFLASGFVKLGIFLFLTKTTDLTISKSDFLHFFFPYVVCVIVEVYYVIKVINEANFNKDK